ncbi:MAG: hypothetical protein JXD23_08540 [Spirochaetales bacterium]|nr:hypothetical protein [Spirochaetales bacterium]
MTRIFEFTDKELVLLYMLLKKKDVPDRLASAVLTAKIEKTLFEFMTIAEIENIEEFYRAL